AGRAARRARAVLGGGPLPAAPPGAGRRPVLPGGLPGEGDRRDLGLRRGHRPGDPAPGPQQAAPPPAAARGGPTVTLERRAGDGVVWVGTSGNGTVARVDPASGRVTATLRLGGRVDGLVQAYGTLWVAYADRAVVTRVDPATATVVGEVPVGRHALGGDAST